MGGEDRGSASACVRRRQPGWVSACSPVGKRKKEGERSEKLTVLNKWGAEARILFFLSASLFEKIPNFFKNLFFCTGSRDFSIIIP